MTKPKPIKPFKTLAEEAAFWDTHDFTSVIEKEKEAIITIRLQKSVKKKLETIAHARGINPSTLSRMWIIEKIYQLIP